VTPSLSLYAGRESWLHRLHPLTKLTATGTLVAAALLLPGAWPNYAVAGLLLLPLALSGRVAREWLRGVWPVVLPFAVSVFLIQGLLWPGGTPLLHLGPVSVKREGLLFAVACVGRIWLLVGAFILFALTTRADRLMIGLTQRGVSPSLAYLVVATVQIIPRFRARAAAILDAQRARGLETEGGLRQRLRALLPLIGPLVLSSLVDVEERALAIEARAFTVRGPKTSLAEVVEAAWEPAARWAMMALAAGLVAARIWLALA